MKPLIVMIAVNEPYESLARDFSGRCGVDILIVTDGMIKGEPSKGLRREKAAFASYIPEDHKGPVILTDADVKVIGEVELPFTPPKGTVAGVQIYKGKTLHHPPGIMPPATGVYLDTMCLYFHDADDAREVSNHWLDTYDSTKEDASPFYRDMWAFNFCAHKFNTMAAPDVSYDRPIRGVEHTFVETRHLPKNIYGEDSRVLTI